MHKKIKNEYQWNAISTNIFIWNIEKNWARTWTSLNSSSENLYKPQSSDMSQVII